ncbi:hypothetical protein DVW31_11340 [Enterococcus faecium]|nr:hypothetical protein DVV90_10915 [Enterococcus faecium]TKL34706.1 hypothetical protein DVW10_10615 [Enterococcus faecium]TKL39603.1 hypothetical protein DVV96_10600 [Enterococcus faecium]TKL41306.1 hypothetical protein DVV92_10510 [Enterococcus faecium]TKL42561.1 hypothetical protein DVW09_10610 [Enterococcus faecium]
MLRPQRFAYNLSYTHTKRIWRTNPLKNPRIDFLDDFFTLMILPKQFCPYFIHKKMALYFLMLVNFTNIFLV